MQENAALLHQAAAALDKATDGAIQIGGAILASQQINLASPLQIMKGLLSAQKSLNQVDLYVFSLTPIQC
jgi:hypothetical protein